MIHMRTALRERKPGQKPRLFRDRSHSIWLWCCEHPDGSVGSGVTPREAYNAWVSIAPMPAWLVNYWNDVRAGVFSRGRQGARP